MSFSGKVSFTVTGLREAVSSLNNIERDLPIVKKAILQEAATVFVQHARANVHVITGNLQRSIRTDLVTDKQAIMSANTRYAGIEENRSGILQRTGTPHAYMQPSADAMAQKLPAIIKQEIDRLFAKNKSSAGFF
jgi:hypothetical protein